MKGVTGEGQASHSRFLILSSYQNPKAKYSPRHPRRDREILAGRTNRAYSLAPPRPIHRTIPNSSTPRMTLLSQVPAGVPDIYSMSRSPDSRGRTLPNLEPLANRNSVFQFPLVGGSKSGIDLHMFSQVILGRVGTFTAKCLMVSRVSGTPFSMALAIILLWVACFTSQPRRETEKSPMENVMVVSIFLGLGWRLGWRKISLGSLI